ncbi:MAG: super-infection exclusion protein B, partial [Bacteroidota bacterium]
FTLFIGLSYFFHNISCAIYFLCTAILFYALAIFFSFKNNKLDKESQTGLMNNLSNDEKTLLQRFINEKTSILRLSKGNTIALNLAKKGILSILTNMLNWQNIKTFRINEWALLYIKKYPESLN